MDALQVGSSNSTTFTLDEDEGPVYFLGWTKGTNVEMQYQVQAPPPRATTTGTATGTGSAAGSTAKSGTGRSKELPLVGFWVQAAFVGLLAVLVL